VPKWLTVIQAQIVQASDITSLIGVIYRVVLAIQEIILEGSSRLYAYNQSSSPHNRDLSNSIARTRLEFQIQYALDLNFRFSSSYDPAFCSGLVDDPGGVVPVCIETKLSYMKIIPRLD
jgi:hypothetical protein